MILRLQHPATTRDSYLMGTMHVSDKCAFTFVDKALDLMPTCGHYYGEMDMRTFDYELLSKAFNLPEDKQYSRVLTPRKYNRVKSILMKSFNLELELYEYCSPLFFQTLMAASILNKDYPVNLDQYLLQKAMEFDMIISGLETIEEQGAIASKLDIETQYKQFLDVCRNTAKFKQKLKYYGQLYSTGNFKQLYYSSSSALGSFKKILLHDRNIRMCERIDKIIANESAFITVGAGHLGGQSGLIALLKKQKIKVIPVV